MSAGSRYSPKGKRGKGKWKTRRLGKKKIGTEKTVGKRKKSNRHLVLRTHNLACAVQDKSKTIKPTSWFQGKVVRGYSWRFVASSVSEMIYFLNRHLCSRPNLQRENFITPRDVLNPNISLSCPEGAEKAIGANAEALIEAPQITESKTI